MNIADGFKGSQCVRFHSIITSTPFCFLSLILTIGNLSGCALFDHGRSVYDREGIRIGIEADPSVRPSSQGGVNNHPMDLTPTELELLLQVIQVSGYSGTMVGLITKPEPVPLFTPKELSVITGHLATAFREAKPTERVSFSLPKPDVTYSEDRTVGFLFFRGRYLHVVLTDHSSFIRTDTGGGEYKDIRDTKGMKLWVAGPARAATVPDLEEPQWAHFEKVHISLDVKRVLARKEHVPAAPLDQTDAGTPVPLPAAVSPESRQGGASPEDQQLQIRELSDANQELKIRLDEQNKRTQQLQDQIEQLRRELPQLAPKRKSHKTIPAQ
ncbi:MAG: hypothetical protein OJF50_003827 [Nitrospira sp.]|jgi:hypothetical protein|nr:hypothetical protein [Nitrospira sp.]